MLEVKTAQQIIEHRILLQHQVIARRLREDPRGVIAHARQNLARWASNYVQEPAPGWMSEWRNLLEAPLDRLASTLVSDSEEGRRLRSSSPFAGVLSAQERWLLLKQAS